MASWNEVKALLAERFTVDDKGEFVRLLFGEDDGRSQVVLVGAGGNENTGEQWLRIDSVIGKVGEVDVVAAARAADRWLCGGIVVTGDFVVLHHSAPMANLDVNELLRPMNVITDAADQIERELTGKDDF